MCPPLHVHLPPEDVVVVGEVPLDGWSMQPGKTGKLATLSFVPGRRHIEDLVHTKGRVDALHHVHNLETRKDVGYQWWDLRVELVAKDSVASSMHNINLDDAKHAQSSKCGRCLSHCKPDARPNPRGDDDQICANTFGTFLLLVNKRAFFAPPKPRSDSSARSFGENAGQECPEELDHLGDSSFPGDQLGLPREASELVVTVHKADQSKTGGRDEGGGLEKGQKKKKKSKTAQKREDPGSMYMCRNPVHAVDNTSSCDAYGRG